MTEMNKDELLRFRDGHYMTVGDLKKYIDKHNIPDTALVVTEVVDDRYFNGGFDISGFRGPNGILPEGSRSGEWKVYVKDRDGLPTRYHPIWCPVSYKNDENDILFLEQHF